MRWGCGIFLSVGFVVSLGQRKFSDLAFSNVLVRPSLILHCAGYAIVEPLVGFSSVAVPAAPAAGSLRLLYNLSGCVCLSCSCAGGVGWAAAFPLRSKCFSCAGWLADDRWVPHPVRVVLPKRL